MNQMNSTVKTVLVVNDDPVTRMIVRAVFEQRGWSVYEAGNGELACNFLKDSGISIHWIILDLTMPVMNGYQFLEWVTKQDCSAKVIVLTADENPNIEVLLNGYRGVVKEVLRAPLLDNMPSLFCKIAA